MVVLSLFFSFHFSLLLLLLLFFLDAIQVCLLNISPKSKSNNGVKKEAVVTVHAGKTINRHARNLMDL